MKKSLAFFLMFVALVGGACEIRGVTPIDVCDNTTCPPGSECQPNPIDPSSPVCVPTTCDNDGACESTRGETSANCPNDCGNASFCGDGTCDDNESVATCPNDCHQNPVCGDGVCQTGENCDDDCQVVPDCGNGACEALENFSVCPADCTAPVCGDHLCELGEPSGCPTDCLGVCGNLFCEGTENNENCSSDCPVTSTCNNGSCEQGENNETCPADCEVPQTCGNGVCNKTGSASDIEDAGNCPIDCHPDPLIDLGNFCVGIANDYLFNSNSGVAYKIVGPAAMPNSVTMNQVVTVGVFKYLKLCNLTAATYEIWATDAQGGSWFWGDPEVYGNIADQGLCWVDRDDPPFAGFHGRFIMSSNGHAVGDGDQGGASCPNPGTVNPFCGDGTCNNGETQSSCSADCGTAATCDNDGVCESGNGETSSNCSNDCVVNTSLAAPAAFATVSGQVRCVGFDVSYISGGSSGTKQWEQYSPSFLQDNIADQNANASRVERCNFNANQIYEGTYKISGGNYALYGQQSTLSQLSDANKQVIFQDSAGNIKLRFKFDSNNNFIPCGNKGLNTNALPSGCN